MQAITYPGPEKAQYDHGGEHRYGGCQDGGHQTRGTEQILNEFLEREELLGDALAIRLHDELDVDSQVDDIFGLVQKLVEKRDDPAVPEALEIARLVVTSLEGTLQHGQELSARCDVDQQTQIALVCVHRGSREQQNLPKASEPLDRLECVVRRPSPQQLDQVVCLIAQEGSVLQGGRGALLHESRQGLERDERQRALTHLHAEVDAELFGLREPHVPQIRRQQNDYIELGQSGYEGETRQTLPRPVLIVHQGPLLLGAPDQQVFHGNVLIWQDGQGHVSAVQLSEISSAPHVGSAWMRLRVCKRS